MIDNEFFNLDKTINKKKFFLDNINIISIKIILIIINKLQLAR